MVCPERTIISIMEMRTEDFDYHLPPELIAQTPIEPRDSAMLLVMHRSSGSLEHLHFFDLPDLLCEGDVMVFNDSRVIPARLAGKKYGTGGSGDSSPAIHSYSPA